MDSSPGRKELQRVALPLSKQATLDARRRVTETFCRSGRLSAASPASQPEPRTSWRWDEQQLRQWQLSQLNEQLAAVLPSNQFYRRKLGVDSLQIGSLDELAELPLTSKQELVDAQARLGVSD